MKTIFCKKLELNIHEKMIIMHSIKYSQQIMAEILLHVVMILNFASTNGNILLDFQPSDRSH